MESIKSSLMSSYLHPSVCRFTAKETVPVELMSAAAEWYARCEQWNGKDRFS